MRELENPEGKIAMKKLCSIFIMGLLIVLAFSPFLHTLRAEEKEVIVKNFTFKPKEVVVPAGVTVIWVQKDRAPHTITAKDGTFDSGKLTKGDKFAQTFTKKGTFEDTCQFHPSMRGKVIVK